MRMIWGVRALNTMARHAHSSAAAKCPQQGRRYFPIRASFSRRDNFRVVSMKAKTLPLSFFSLFQIPGTKKAPSFRGRRHSRKRPALSYGRLVTGAQGSPTRQKRYKTAYRAPPFLSDGFSIHGQETFVKPICPPGKNPEDFSKCCGAGGENIVY